MGKTIEANLSGKTAVITGATTGMGKEIAFGLAKLGADVVLPARDPKKAEATQKEIVAAVPTAKVRLETLDVSELSSVRAFVGRLGKGPVHILVNNAGMWTTDPKKTSDGHELIWATNVLGPFLLTQLLVPALKAANGARIVNVASSAAGGLDLTDVEYQRRSFSGFNAYSASKQALRMLTWSFAEQLAGAKVTANATNPGFVRTQFNREAGGMFFFMKYMSRLFARPPAVGADVSLWVAASPEMEGVTGKFFTDRKDVACKFRNAEQQRALWEICERSVGAASAAAA